MPFLCSILIISLIIFSKKQPQYDVYEDMECQPNLTAGEKLKRYYKIFTADCAHICNSLEINCLYLSYRKDIIRGVCKIYRSCKKIPQA